MKLDDVLMLAHAGYSKADIAALLGSNTAPAPTTPKAAPLTGAPPLPGDVATNVTASASSPAAPSAAPSAPDWGAMAQSIAALTARLDTLATPTAGSLSDNTADAVSVDDIIRAAITPAAPDAAPDFSKGV